MGNRGILHNDAGEIIAPWQHRAWVTCVLEYKGRRRQVFSHRRYSELFFLDEATALSAGHRPCAFCRRERFNEFKALWCRANMDGAPPSSVPAPVMDRRLHSERALRGGGKATFVMKPKDLPAGAFIEHGGRLTCSGRAFLCGLSAGTDRHRIFAAGGGCGADPGFNGGRAPAALPQVHGSAEGA